MRRITSASAILTLVVLGGCSTDPSPPIVAGTWTGTASDAGAFEWVLTQDRNNFSGRVVIVNVPMSSPTRVEGTVSGTISGSLVRFDQSVCLGPVGPTGPCEVTVLTTGNLNLMSGHLTGDYLGAAQSLRSPPGPLGVGTEPFIKGTLTMTRQ